MNRRSFLTDLLKGAVAFTILPSAGRIWKAERRLIKVDYYLFHAPIFHFSPSFQNFIHIKCETMEADTVYEKLMMGEWPPNTEKENERLTIHQTPSTHIHARV